MRFSETTTKLLEALHKAQSNAEAPKKTEKAKGVNYTYTKLEQVLEVFHNHYTPEGLVINFGNGAPLQDGGITVIARITHAKSGEWMEVDHHTITDRQNGPQGIGSATTYGRRYALLGAMGLSPEDDDGQSAQAGNATPKAATPKPISPANQKALDEAKISANDWCTSLGITANQAWHLADQPNMDDLQSVLRLVGYLQGLDERRHTPNQLTEAEAKALTVNQQGHAA